MQEQQGPVYYMTLPQDVTHQDSIVQARTTLLVTATYCPQTTMLANRSTLVEVCNIQNP